MVEAIVGASAAKAAKNSERLTGLIDKLDGDALHRISVSLDTEYSNKWSPGKKGDPMGNIRRHYNEHADEWGTNSQGELELTLNDYIGKAHSQANKRDGVEIYYQRDKRNLAIYDENADEIVAVNHQQEIQTLFKPDEDYITKKIKNGIYVRVK